MMRSSVHPKKQHSHDHTQDNLEESAIMMNQENDKDYYEDDFNADDEETPPLEIKLCLGNQDRDIDHHEDNRSNDSSTTTSTIEHVFSSVLPHYCSSSSQRSKRRQDKRNRRRCRAIRHMALGALLVISLEIVVALLFFNLISSSSSSIGEYYLDDILNICPHYQVLSHVRDLRKIDQDRWNALEKEMGSNSLIE